MSESTVLKHSWKARIRRRRGRAFDTVATRELNLVAMMDMMTIILVFLLKSYSGSALSVDPGSTMQFAASTHQVAPEDALKLTVTKIGGENPGEISVGDQRILSLDAGTIKKLSAMARNKKFLIPELAAVLKQQAVRAREEANLIGDKTFEGQILVVADKETPYWLVTQVLFTSADSGYDKYNLVAIKKHQ